MFALATALEFEATSEDHSILDALDHALAHWSGRREFIPDHSGGVPLDLSFVSVNWRRAIRDRKHPGMLDVAVTGGRRLRRLEPAPAHLRGVRSPAQGVL